MTSPQVQRLTDALYARRAMPVDAEAVARLAIETFVAKFGHLYNVQDLQTYLHLAYSVDAVEQTLRDADSETWLLCDSGSGETLGFALIGKASLPHPDIGPADGEIKRFYVDPTRTGQGLGAQFMDFILTRLLKDGPRTLWLGVYSDNDGAQRFYSRYGFERAGEYLFPVGETRDREYIFKRVAP